MDQALIPISTILKFSALKKVFEVAVVNQKPESLERTLTYPSKSFISFLTSVWKNISNALGVGGKVILKKIFYIIYPPLRPQLKNDVNTGRLVTSISSELFTCEDTPKPFLLIQPITQIALRGKDLTLTCRVNTLNYFIHSFIHPFIHSLSL